jgi:hypothetical protein
MLLEWIFFRTFVVSLLMPGAGSKQWRAKEQVTAKLRKKPFFCYDQLFDRDAWRKHQSF